jgi:5-dehydro-2-deoxygluconokinase
MKNPEKLCILPFDHQTGLWKAFGWTVPITLEQEILMEQTRMIIYQGYLKSLEMGVIKQETAILTDDNYGRKVIEQAKKDNVPVIYTLEKSGQPYLLFNHENWQEKISEIQPDWIKTLVRYNPLNDPGHLQITRENLLLVSNFAKEHTIGFMIEPLVPPTPEQSENNDYDHQLRPDLTVQMIHEIYNAGIFPNIWKIEGSDTTEFYKKSADAIASHDSNARIVVLGRNETLDQVGQWLTVGGENDSVIGFAVGRTVFLDAIKKFIAGEYTDQQAIDQISENYFKLYQTFSKTKTPE